MSEKSILSSIEGPHDLRKLSEDELAQLSGEIRQEIISTASKTGGHVASSLGAVEIIVAVHSVINCPHDKFVFDVGHQAYAHKLLTGRVREFSTLRTYGGLSGFPKPSESPYDVHPSGHASDSLSIAAGLAAARKIKGGNEKVVALIGDASIAGGMAFEALNYIGNEQLPMVIILNDNEMSISKNVGALVKHFGNIRAHNSYRDAREVLQAKLEGSGRVGNAFAQFGKRTKDSIKNMFIPESMIYEQMGIVCTAPVDGHNIHELREMMKLVVQMDGPVLMHVVTKKGQGYAPAMADPERFHGVGAFDVKTGAALAKKPEARTYTQVFGQVMVEEAEVNQDIVAITAAMEGGTGLKAFSNKFPERFIDVGIAEENAVGMAAGLATMGLHPVVAIYSTFMQRAIDQAIIDVALARRNVVFALDRAGLVGDDGPTHHGVFDIAFMRMVPNMKVLTPSCESELELALYTALHMPGPVCVRYPRGAGAGVELKSQRFLLEEGRALVLREGTQCAILAFGRTAQSALEAAQILDARGVSARVVDMRWVKPLDVNEILRAAKTGLVLTVEEGVCEGGAGQGVLDVLASYSVNVKTCVMGIPDEFVGQGPTDVLLRSIELDGQGIANKVLECL
jgi:1-deoxy-D-xylulose-5-phosphate synthase